MASPEQLAWLASAYEAARSVNHKWPGACAAEAAAESGWGVHVPPNSNNYLGIKAYKGWMGPAVSANGTEQYADGHWSGPQLDLWCVFPSMAACFAQQMKILQEPRYELAMAATTIEDYIVKECHIWSTGILKGQAVLQIYHAHIDILGG